MKIKTIGLTFLHLSPILGISLARLWLWLRSTSFIFHISFFIFFFSSCSTQPYVVESALQANDSSLVSIFIVNHGWHTGIIIPAATIQQQLPGLQSRFKDAVYLEFGWGDQGFYQADEITFALTLNAILWPTATVVHVVGLPEDINSYFSKTEKLCISKNELSTLRTFLINSFAHDSLGAIIPGAKGIYGNGQFYKGTGQYHLFNTCNTWTAKGLKSAGYDISPSLKLTAESIMDYITRENALQKKDCL